MNLAKRIAQKLKQNKEGGIDPQGEEQMDRFKNADLITLPEDVEGTNCGNCKFQKDGICTHPQLEDQKINNRMCCKYWDNEKVHRLWAQEQYNSDK